MKLPRKAKQAVQLVAAIAGGYIGTVLLIDAPWLIEQWDSVDRLGFLVIAMFLYEP